MGHGGLDSDADSDWHSAADDSADQLHGLWEEAVTRSRSLVDQALATGGLDQLAARAWPDGRSSSPRGSCAT